MPHPPQRLLPGQRYRLVAALAWRVLLLVLLPLTYLSGVQPAAAGLVTPYVSATLGYTDNVRFSQVARADGFFKVTPGVRLKVGQKPHELEAFVDASYIHYFRLTDLSNFDGGNLGLNYTYSPSPRFQFYTRVRGTSTYNQAALNQQGDLVTIEPGQGRIDRISTTIGAIYRYGPFDRIEAGYTFSPTRHTDPTQEDSVFQEAFLVWASRMAVKYESTLRATVQHTTYDQTPDMDRARLDLQLARYFGPTQRVFANLGLNITRSESSSEVVTSARNYEVATAGLGYSHQVSPRFSWEGSAGWSQVFGNSEFNNAAGQGFPVFDLRTNYKGTVWDLNAYARADLSEFDALGNNTGLTANYLVGASFRYRYTQHWTFFALADYTINEYKQDPQFAETSQGGRVHNYRAQAGVTWQLAKYWRLSLEYHHLTRDAEETGDDRSENKVMLILYSEYPYRW